MTYLQLADFLLGHLHGGFDPNYPKIHASPTLIRERRLLAIRENYPQL